MTTRKQKLPNLKVHYLQYFSVLAEELHFGRAAERLSITQPPLSLAIKSLEDTLSTRLFERDSKHVTLTAAGAIFLEDVRQILDNLVRATETVRSVASGAKGRLDIGVTGSMFYREVPKIVQRFNEIMPAIEITLREVGSNDQIDRILHGQLHAGFLNAATAPQALSSVPLLEDIFVCCLSSKHRLARAKTVKIKQLVDDKFVMFSRDIAQDSYDHVISILRNAGIYPHTCHAARQWLTIIAMIANDMGVSLVPASLSRCGIKGVEFVQLAEDQRFAPAPALLAWKTDIRSKTLLSFIECAKEVIRSNAINASHRNAEVGT